MTANHILVRPSRLNWARAFFAKHPLFVLGAVILVLVISSAVLAPWIAPDAPTKIVMSERLLAPSAEHLMGTDRFGRDMFARILHGGRISLLVGLCVVLLALLIGGPIGLAAGYFGGKTDVVLMRFSDVFLAFPPLLLPIAITAALGPGLWNAMIALAVSWFPWYARIMRASAMTVRRELYISAARNFGVGHLRILIRHVVPNSLTPVIVQASMDFGVAILAAASLSFIGLGARAPTVEWGLMAADARTDFLDHYWTALFPGLAIFVTVLAVNLIGDGLSDILGPKRGGRE
ncbi:ABC transporter permease [Sinorhizobium meliloti]|uniref:ABC transporter permease n=1 Tax=Rhizobium meliloti TaxID=382 RepID=UPI0001E4B5FF|nr:ABC transporter permease [Sinorhizobium meliloti]AEG58122.1 ABC-type transporter, integral membrane subunit [Sinorhizobium meliloti AK83]MDE4589089.1 ABC transporter permease [Sinorhizobium meliloti]SEJ82337.1 peptide/nickel transport system permease protein [Sinorhizobium meliloti]